MSRGGGAGPLGLVPPLTIALFLTPVAAGLLGTALPAFGYMPALGHVGLDLGPWRALLATPGLGRSLALSLVSGIGGTLLALLAAILVVAALHDRPGMRLVRAALAPLLAVPHLASAVGLAFLIAPSGLLVRLAAALAGGIHRPPNIVTVQDSWGLALSVGLALREAPFLIFALLAAGARLELASSLAAARSLGHPPIRAWLKVALPRLYPLIRLPVMAVLAYGLSVVDMALVLAPNAPPPLAVLLLQWFDDPDLGRRLRGSAGALLLLLVTLAILALWRLAERLLAPLAHRWVMAGPRRGGEPVLRGLGRLLATLVLGSGALGLVMLLLWAVAGSWRFPAILPDLAPLPLITARFPALEGPIGTTLVLGLASGLIALALSLGCLEHEAGRGSGAPLRGLWLVYLPLLVPQIAFLFGLEVLLIRLRLDATWAAVIWSHLVFVLPYTFLLLREPYLRLDRRYAAAGRSLGRGAAYVWLKVKLPLLAAPVATALAIGFSVSVAQYLPTLFVGAGRFRTLTTEALALAQSGDRRLTGAMALVLALLPLLALASAALVGRRRP